MLPAARHLCRTDLFFLLRFGLGRKDVERQWLFDRCREVQAAPDGYLDLWAREHYKSTIITYGKSIQDILGSHGDDPLPQWNGREATVGIFSHTRPIAKGFLRQIKYEFERNQLLKDWFPDILWQYPQKSAPKWSEDDGIVVKRKGNPKEATVEAWGVVDGQPVGKHFLVLDYDDIVVPASVTTPDMIQKTTEAVELSYALGAEGGLQRFVGTRYHFNDTYRVIMERGTAIKRIHTATYNGQIDGDPVLLTREALAKKRRDMGPYTFSCQMMQNPKADETQGLKEDWLRYYDGVITGSRMNKYILVDPANGKRKQNDYTSIWIIGAGEDENFYALEFIRDRLNLTQRCRKVIDLHRKWRPLQVRYEHYGMQADIQALKMMQGQEEYRFDVIDVGGTEMPKNDRIKRIIPMLEQGRFYLPRTQHYTDYEGEVRDLTKDFLEQEYKAFPVPVHDDMLDCLARIAEPDLPVVFPKQKKSADPAAKKVRGPNPQGAGWLHR